MTTQPTLPHHELTKLCQRADDDVQALLHPADDAHRQQLAQALGYRVQQMDRYLQRADRFQRESNAVLTRHNLNQAHTQWQWFQWIQQHQSERPARPHGPCPSCRLTNTTPWEPTCRSCYSIEVNTAILR